MDSNFKVDVDKRFLDEVTDELYIQLVNQNYKFSKRLESFPFGKKSKLILKLTGLFISIFGFLLSVYALLMKPGWCLQRLNEESYYLFFLATSLVFVLTTLFFIFISKIEPKVKKWSRKYAAKNCWKYSQRVMKKAHEFTPFIAKYEVRENVIEYYREKGKERNLAWSRKLFGAVYQGKRQTLIFKKTTSLYPVIQILHKDAKPINKLLKELKINVEKIPKMAPQNYSFKK